MKRSVTLFLQAAVVALGLGVLALMLWEPHLEGRNVDATLLQIYFGDPFLAYVYLASTAFFVGLYQVFKLVGYAGHNGLLSQAAAQALRIITYCAVALAVFVLGAEAYFFTVMRDKDDIAGGVMMGLIIIALSTLVGVGAYLFERSVQKRASANL